MKELEIDSDWVLLPEGEKELRGFGLLMTGTELRWYSRVDKLAIGLGVRWPAIPVMLIE